MTDKRTIELAEQFEGLTIKKMMKVLAFKSGNSRLYFNEIMDEFEKTLLQAYLEKYQFNKLKMSMGIKMHRNTISKKIEKFRIKEKKKKTPKTTDVKEKAEKK